jgi:hypothetical protein
VIPPALPIWLLDGLPPDLPGAPHGWPPTADDSVRRATPLDPAAAAAAAATTPDEAGRAGPAELVTCDQTIEGKTRREALRCLKRRIADHVWRVMLADEQARDRRQLQAS